MVIPLIYSVPLTFKCRSTAVVLVLFFSMKLSPYKVGFSERSDTKESCEIRDIETRCLFIFVLKQIYCKTNTSYPKKNYVAVVSAKLWNFSEFRIVSSLWKHGWGTNSWSGVSCSCTQIMIFLIIEGVTNAKR